AHLGRIQPREAPALDDGLTRVSCAPHPAPGLRPPAGVNLSCGAMADWIFQGNPRRYDLHASVASSRKQWWGPPGSGDRLAVVDRAGLQCVGPKDPGLSYVATIVSETYEHPVQPSGPAHFRWRTDIGLESRFCPPLLRSELLED